MRRLQEGKTIFLFRFRNPLPENPAVRVSVLTLIANLLLTAFKLFAGLFGGSGAMVADAVHSASDVCTTVLVLIGVRISARQADETHPYGHERLECLVSLTLGIFLFAVGAGIGWNGVKALLFPAEQARPSVLALTAAIVSILAKECMYRCTIRVANRVPSAALSLRADAWHHRSDALSSVGSLAGIGGAMLGFSRADSLAAALLSLLILAVAFGICRDALRRLVDRAASPELEQQVRELVLAQEGVCSVDLLRTRLFGARVDVDLEIGVRADLPLVASHEIAERVRAAVCSCESVKLCTVHVNPVS